MERSSLQQSTVEPSEEIGNEEIIAAQVQFYIIDKYTYGIALFQDMPPFSV